MTRRVEPSQKCPSCGYLLAGAARGGRCPECGSPIVPGRRLAADATPDQLPMPAAIAVAIRTAGSAACLLGGLVLAWAVEVLEAIGGSPIPFEIQIAIVCAGVGAWGWLLGKPLDGKQAEYWGVGETGAGVRVHWGALVWWAIAAWMGVRGVQALLAAGAAVTAVAGGPNPIAPWFAAVCVIACTLHASIGAMHARRFAAWMRDDAVERVVWPVQLAIWFGGVALAAGLALPSLGSRLPLTSLGLLPVAAAGLVAALLARDGVFVLLHAWEARDRDRRRSP